MSRHRTIETSSVVDAPTIVVWQSVTSPEGINGEIRPILRMTVPRPFRGKSIADVSPGTRLGRSWFLLLGVLPIDFDDICIAELDDGHRFKEVSTMLSMRTWTHERTLAPDGAGTRVSDVVHFETRAPLGWIPGWTSLMHAFLTYLFGHRHRNLARLATVGPGRDGG